MSPHHTINLECLIFFKFSRFPFSIRLTTDDDLAKKIVADDNLKCCCTRTHHLTLLFAVFFSEPFLGHSIALLLIRLCCRAKLLRCLFAFVAVDDDEVTVSHQTPTETCVCQIPSWKLHDLRKIGNRLEFFFLDIILIPSYDDRQDSLPFHDEAAQQQRQRLFEYKFHYLVFSDFPFQLQQKSISHEYS